MAHNARFDYGFIKNEFRRLDIKFTAEVLCTVQLSRRLYPEFKSHSLDALRERHQLTTHGRHRALGDARAAWQLIETAVREHAACEVTSAVKILLKMPSLPPQLLPGVLDDLPEGPGVYTFYGINGLPIYIGKGKNIRSRVRSHFSSDYRSANDQRLSVEIMRISFEETAGELGALLRESKFIKTLMPLRNHALRRNQELAFVRLSDHASLPEVIAVADVDFSDTDNLYGPFPSKSRARAAMMSLAADHGLCWQVLSAKSSDKSCFAYQLQKCRGYCVAHESLAQHNMRLMTALTATKFRSWPCAGPIAIRETHPERGCEQVHVFEKWHHIGSEKSESEIEDLLTTRVSRTFDADIYELLARYFERGGQRTSRLHFEPQSTCD